MSRDELVALYSVSWVTSRRLVNLAFCVVSLMVLDGLLARRPKTSRYK